MDVVECDEMKVLNFFELVKRNICIFDFKYWLILKKKINLRCIIDRIL